LRSYSFFDALTHTRSELKSAKLIRVIVHLHAPDPNPSNGFQKKKKADYIMCALGKSSSVRQLDNNPSGAHLFFFFLAHNQPLVCFWPTVPIDNRPIGLIFFFFLLLLGSQLALVSSRTIVPIDNSTSGSSFFFCSWPTIGPFSVFRPLSAPFQKKRKEEEVDNSFFNFRLKSAINSHQSSPPAVTCCLPTSCLLRQHPSVFTTDLRFLFSNSSF